MAKIVHIVEWDDDDPIFDFKLLGLESSIIKDYSIAFYLNQHCGFNFVKIKDHEIIDNNIVYNFSVYRFYHHKTKQQLELVSNYSNPISVKEEELSLFTELDNIKTLIPEFKSFNFFLKSDFLLDEEFYVTLQKLVSIKRYSDIDIEQININNLENLIFSK